MTTTDVCVIESSPSPPPLLSTGMVPGYENDYVSDRDSPVAPPYSPLTPIARYRYQSNIAIRYLCIIIIIDNTQPL